MAARPAKHKRPGSAPERPLEIGIHISIADFLRVAWPDDLPWWHTPNGEKRDKITKTRADGSTVTFSPTGAKLKRMGALAGVPEFTFIMPNAQASFMEVKRPGECLSDDQIAFRNRAIALGCAYVVVQSLEEAVPHLGRWLAAYGLTLRARLAAATPLFGSAA